MFLIEGPMNAFCDQQRRGQECKHPRVDLAQEAQCNQLSCSMRSSGSRNLMSWQRGWTNKLGRLIDKGCDWTEAMGFVLVLVLVNCWFGTQKSPAEAHACGLCPCMLPPELALSVANQVQFHLCRRMFVWKLSWLAVMHQLTGTKRIGIWQRHQA